MRKVIFCLVGVILVVGLVLGCAPKPAPAPTPTPAPTPAPTPTPAPAPAAPITLKAVTFFPPTFPLMAGMKIFAERVNTQAKGRLAINVAGGPEVIPSWDQPDAVRTGLVDMALTPDSSAIFPPNATVVWCDLSNKELRKSGFDDLLDELYRKTQGIERLGMLAGFRRMHMYLNVEVKTPYDLAGRKLRTSPNWDDFFAALGVGRVSMSDMDLYPAMERHVVEGYIAPPDQLLSLGLWEVSNYIIVPPIFRVNQMLLVNLKSWNRLPKDLQDLVRKIAIEVETELDDSDFKAYQADVEKLLAKGMKSITFSTADAKWFTDLAYDTQWKRVIAYDPVNGPKLKELAGR